MSGSLQSLYIHGGKELETWSLSYLPVFAAWCWWFLVI